MIMKIERGTINVDGFAFSVRHFSYFRQNDHETKRNIDKFAGHPKTKKKTRTKKKKKKRKKKKKKKKKK